jgi:hypothetical protein
MMRSSFLQAALFAYGCCATVFAPSHAQNVDFDDLRKPGPGLRATAVIGGLGKEASDLVARFNEVDRARIEERRAAQVAAAAIPAPGAGSDQGARRPQLPTQPSRFVCSFRCTDNRLIVINAGKSGPLSLAVMALDQGRARDVVSSEAKNVCWDQFKLTPKADFFPCRQQ